MSKSFQNTSALIRAELLPFSALKFNHVQSTPDISKLKFIPNY